MDLLLKDPAKLQGFIANVNGQIEIGLTALKNLFIVHTGAVAAILAFMGQATNGDKNKAVFDVAYSCLPYFGYGIFVSFLMFLSAYFYQYNVSETWRTKDGNWNKHNCRIYILFVLTLILFFLDLGLFCIGAYKAYINLPFIIQ